MKFFMDNNVFSFLVNWWQINQLKQCKKGKINCDECLGSLYLNNCSFGLRLPLNLLCNLTLHDASIF